MAVTQKKQTHRSRPYAMTKWDNPQPWIADEPIDERTKSALKWVERKSGVRITVVQGSYQAKFGGSATTSAGTHDQGGVVDVMTVHLKRRQRIKMIRWAKRAGFAAWYRNWPGNQHSHWVLRGHRNLAPSAAAQVRDFDAGRTGLVGALVDHTWRPRKPRRWSHRQGKPVIGR